MLRPQAYAILLHNGFENSKTWAHIVPWLEPRFGVLTYDRRGYSGVSAGAPPDGGLVADGVKELEAFVSERIPPGGRFFLWGHCIGGAIALSFAARRPEGLAGVFAEAVGFSSNPELAEKAHWVLLPWHALDAKTRDGFTVMHGKEAETLWETIREYRGSYIMDPHYSILDRMGRIRVPVLLWQGTRDFYFSSDEARAAAALIPGARVQIEDGGSHDLHRDRADRAAKLFLRFAASVIEGTPPEGWDADSVIKRFP